MTTNQKYWLTLIASFVIGYLGWSAPSYRMPIDYDAMVSRSVPLAATWVAISAFCLWHFKKRGLWALLGTPMALYWPIWLLFNHFPACYYLHNCV
jgi:hypothetical protein